MTSQALISKIHCKLPVNQKRDRELNDCIIIRVIVTDGRILSLHLIIYNEVLLSGRIPLLLGNNILFSSVGVVAKWFNSSDLKSVGPGLNPGLKKLFLRALFVFTHMYKGVSVTFCLGKGGIPQC